MSHLKIQHKISELKITLKIVYTRFTYIKCVFVCVHMHIYMYMIGRKVDDR